MNAKSPLISEEIVEFLQSGLAIVIATRDNELQPFGAPGWAVKVHSDRTHVTVYAGVSAGESLLRNLKAHPEIAVVLDRPSTHRACQLKGVLKKSRKARDAERKEVQRQNDGFRSDLEMIGLPKAMTEEWNPWPCMALEFEVQQIFEQTPGPGAGEPIK